MLGGMWILPFKPTQKLVLPLELETRRANWDPRDSLGGPFQSSERFVRLAKLELGLAMVVFRMDHLMFLGLADNGLSNHSIRKLTVNARMTGRGPRRLRSLDLSCNYNIDRNSLHYLNKTFRQVDNLNLARTSVPVRVSPINLALQPQGRRGREGFRRSARPSSTA